MESSAFTLALLEENLSSLSEFSTKISTSLATISKSNSKAISNLGPLLNEIEQSKTMEYNLEKVYGKIGRMEEYGSKTNAILESMQEIIYNNSKSNKFKQLGSFGHLANLKVNDLEKYIGYFENLLSIEKEMNGKNITIFKGLRDALDKGVDEGEITLKRSVKLKLRAIADIQRELVKGENVNLGTLIDELKYLYSYLIKRGFKLDDTIIQERKDFARKNCDSIQFIWHSIGNDKNDIYTGKSGKRFMEFTTRIQEWMIVESNFIYAFFKELQSNTAISGIIEEILQTHLNAFSTGLNNAVTDISKNKTVYATMFFEVALSTNRIIEWLNKHKINVPSNLLHMLDMATSESIAVFRDWFTYINNMFAQAQRLEHPSLISEYTMIIGRLKNFANLHEEELHFISLMKPGEWLPENSPKNFPKALPTAEPRMMLSYFYSDIIIYAFYILLAKYEPFFSDEDIGVMLLQNLDASRALIDHNTLRSILGQQGTERLAKLNKKAMDKAAAPWSNLASKIMEASTMATAGSGSVSMRSKDLNKFVEDFNIKFDELCLGLSNKPVMQHFKQQLVKEVQSTLVPAYMVFYKKVHTVKGVKHLKTEAEVKSKISALGQ